MLVTPTTETNMTLTPQILAMYLNGETLCEYKDEDGNEITAPILAINIQGYAAFVDPEFEEWIPIANVKPFLRPLSFMTEEEARQVFILEGWGENLENIVVEDGLITCKTNVTNQAIQRLNRLHAPTFAYLLSKSFDLFGLIESGLAIELKPEQKQ